MSTDVNRFLSAGTKFLVKDTGVYRILAGIVGIGGPEVTTDDVEATELDPYQDSTTTPAVLTLIKKYLAGWSDIGELNLELNMTSQEYSFTIAMQLARTTTQFKINLRNGWSILIQGYFKGTRTDLQLSELAKAPVTIKLTDAIYFAQTGSAQEIAW